MNIPKMRFLVALGLFPFVLTACERWLIKPVLSTFPLPDTSHQLLKVLTVSLLLLAISSFRENLYGLEITRKLKKPLTLMFIALIIVSYFFLFSLKLKGYFDTFAAIHLINWMLTVFREEFILRGVIQTEAKNVIQGSFLKISYSIWFTTCIFSLWHLVNLVIWPWHVVAQQMLSCILSGIILGLIREKTGNTLLTYLLHITGDLLFFTMHTLILGTLFFTLF